VTGFKFFIQKTRGLQVHIMIPSNKRRRHGYAMELVLLKRDGNEKSSPRRTFLGIFRYLMRKLELEGGPSHA
jgi:hypothetical protein